MADDLKDIKDQLKEIVTAIGHINVTLGKQEVNIKHHIYRTDLAEENIKLIKLDVEPIKKHVAMVEGVLKFFGVCALFIGMAAGIVKVLMFCGFHF